MMPGDKMGRIPERDSWQIQATRYGLLSEVVLLIAKTSDLQRLLTGTINKVKWVIDFERCTLALLNGDQKTYRLQTLLETRRSVAPVEAASVPLDQGIAGEVMRTRQTLLIADLTTPHSELPKVVDPALADGSLKTVMSLPLHAYGKMLGALTFSTVRADGYSREDIKVAHTIATHLALAIEHWQQTKKLQQANEELARLASFPELNPGPIIEVDLSGQVHYLNPAAMELFPDCPEIGLAHPLLVDLGSVVADLQAEGENSVLREIKIGEVWY